MQDPAQKSGDMRETSPIDVNKMPWPMVVLEVTLSMVPLREISPLHSCSNKPYPFEWANLLSRFLCSVRNTCKCLLILLFNDCFVIGTRSNPNGNYGSARIQHDRPRRENTNATKKLHDDPRTESLSLRYRVSS
jgi:hypothetical protein